MAAILFVGYALVGCALVGGAFFGCATIGSGPPTVAIRITGNDPDATVWIDDRLAGRLADFSKSGKRLGLGFHRIEVRAPGAYSFFQEVEVKPGSDVAIQAVMHELLP